MKLTNVILVVVVLGAIGHTQTTVHDHINNTNTTVSCGQGSCDVYDQDKVDLNHKMTKAEAKFCKANHIKPIWKKGSISDVCEQAFYAAGQDDVVLRLTKEKK